MYAYWDRLRGREDAPARADVDPTAIPHLLADTFLLGKDAAGELAIRVAGTRVCALLCRELKGERFVALFNEGSGPALRQMLVTVCERTVGGLASVICNVSERGPAELELLILPLRQGRRADRRLLGVLAPLTPISLGMRPAADLDLRAHGFITPVRQSAAVPPQAAACGGRAPPGLVVFEGGRAP